MNIQPNILGVIHQATISATVLDSAGKVVMEAILETKALSKRLLFSNPDQL